MKIGGVAVFLLCICFSLSAQEESSVKDSVVPHRMSFEEADSLLIRLSKEKSKKSKCSDREISGDEVAGMDTLSASAPDTVIVEENREGMIDFQIVPDTLVEIVTAAEPELPPVADSISVGVTVVKPPEKTRQKAKISRNELLIEQEGGEIRLRTEDEEDVDLRSINEGSVFGVGGYKMKDDFLSPEKYGGAGFRFMNERMRLTKLADYKISRQNSVNVDISSAINGAENANFLSAFVDYSLGYHYRYLPDPYFKIMAGACVRSLFGMVYNTRNGNNPMTLHADLDLNLSLIAIHEFRVKKHLFAIRYQFETPFVGVLFCPVYGQSYYEIFTLGNTAEVFNFTSFRHKFAMRHYLTLDFPLGNTTLRIGYLGSFYATDVHGIDRSVISHNAMLGFVKEFVVFGGRDMARRKLFRSAYY
jgi:hypothetical protein